MRNGYFTGIGIACEKFARGIAYQCGEFLSSFTQRRDLGDPNGTSVMLFFENIEPETHDGSGEAAAIRCSGPSPIESAIRTRCGTRGWVQAGSVV